VVGNARAGRTTPRPTAYWASRPRGSRLSAAASPQSEVIPRARGSRRAARGSTPPGEEIDRPEHWGGFRVAPLAVEFWQGRPTASTTACASAGKGTGGIVERLAP
jgi:pyridoxamine 5'-phosphate oxidase